MDHTLLDNLEDALRQKRLTVDRVQDTFNVSQGKGVMSHRAHIDPEPLAEALADVTDDTQRRRLIAGFASGVKQVLLEPTRSKARDWDYIQSAGGLLPTVENSAFRLGVTAAAGEAPWTIDFQDGLLLAYTIRLDLGIRVLTTPQVNDWAVSSDRITAAARSLLFHKTRDLTPQPFAPFEGVHRLHGGDGHDAARFLVVADVFYTEIGEGFRFALPTPDHLLFTYDSDRSSLNELRRATDQTFRETGDPLSSKIFRFQAGKPTPIEETF